MLKGPFPEGVRGGARLGRDGGVEFVHVSAGEGESRGEFERGVHAAEPGKEVGGVFDVPLWRRLLHLPIPGATLILLIVFQYYFSGWISSRFYAVFLYVAVFCFRTPIHLGSI